MLTHILAKIYQPERHSLEEYCKTHMRPYLVSMADDTVEPELALEVQVPWSLKTLDGSKTVETRAYALPAEYLHKPILLVESPPGGLASHGLDQGQAVGVVVFSSCKAYTTRHEWAADTADHGVDPSAPPEAFGWVEGTAKYGWVVGSVRAVPRRQVALSEAQRQIRSIFSLKDSQDGR